MPVSVTDTRSNFNDQIVYAARMIGASKNRALVFDAVCSGKKKIKTRDEIAATTKLSSKQVLDAGKQLASRHLITQTKKDGQTAYEKDPGLAPHKKMILKLARDSKAREKVPTKVQPRAGKAAANVTVNIAIPRALVEVRQVTVDDIDSFAKVRDVEVQGSKCKLPEKKMKKGVQAIVGEPGEFNDWGGEKNDLWTTRLMLDGRRRPTAFAFKGPGTKGKLTPKKMGTHGDQIQRLFQSEAEIFIVHYWREIDESVVEQIRQFATAKSATLGKEIVFGVIDGKDSLRLVTAYPEHF
jgi:hypothetical protein